MRQYKEKKMHLKLAQLSKFKYGLYFCFGAMLYHWPSYNAKYIFVLTREYPTVIRCIVNTKLTSAGPSTGQLLLFLCYHCIELPTITTVPNVLLSLCTPTQFPPPVFTANYLTIYFTVRLFNINTLNYKLNSNLFKSLCAINAVPNIQLSLFLLLPGKSVFSCPLWI